VKPNPAFLVQLKEYEMRIAAGQESVIGDGVAAVVAPVPEEFDASIELEGDEDADLAWITPANLKKVSRNLSPLFFFFLTRRYILLFYHNNCYHYYYYY